MRSIRKMRSSGPFPWSTRRTVVAQLFTTALTVASSSVGMPNSIERDANVTILKRVDRALVLAMTWLYPEWMAKHAFMIALTNNNPRSNAAKVVAQWHSNLSQKLPRASNSFCPIIFTVESEDPSIDVHCLLLLPAETLATFEALERNGLVNDDEAGVAVSHYDEAEVRRLFQPRSLCAEMWTSLSSHDLG